MYHLDDPRVMVVQFEQLTREPVAVLTSVMEHCNLQVPDTLLTEVLDDYTKTKMRQRDLAQRPDVPDSHYRSRSSRHEETFTDGHYELFSDVTGDLLSVLGYE